MNPLAPPRRRLGALEAAAAMAVIVACIAALANLTGVLPASMHFEGSGSGTSRDGLAPAAAVVVPAAQDSDASASVQAASPPAPTAPSKAASAALTAGPTMPATAAAAVTGEPVQRDATGATPAAAAPATQVASAGMARHRIGHGHRPPPGHLAAGNTTENAPGAGRKTGKTREQVIAELLQSKRDGTYPAQTETYR